MSDDPPHTVIDGRYDVESSVGSGGFSTVWRASDRDGGPDIAVKFPKRGAESVNSATQVQDHFGRAYEMYAEFVGSILPRSIARFVTGRRSNPAYVGMEYIDGTDLGEHVPGPGASPGMEAARLYGFPVIRALEFLHYNGYCYLDCKPANVIVTRRTDSPVLIDFNTVCPFDDADEMRFYEDPYKAPEQTPDDHRDGAAGPPADVYAGGKLLCYLLSGATFDTSDTPSEGVDPRSYGGECSRAVAEVVERATKADPNDRYETAHELLMALYDATGRETRTARLTDRGSNVVCPIRPGDSLGRLTDEGADPDITLPDPRRHVSPVHCAFSYDTSWLLTDTSLNGTYVDLDGEWVYLLSDEGRERLRRQGDERVDGEVYAKARIHDDAAISPVHPDYSIDLHVRI